MSKLCSTLGILGFIVCFSISAFGQQMPIMGKITAANSNTPLGFVTVMTYDATDSSRIACTTSQENGTFSIEVEKPDIYLSFSFMGFKTQYKLINLSGNSDTRVVNIALEANEASLDGIVVRAEKSSTEFKLDKRIFNVGKDLSSTGASALEVLNNVPSVNVNIEGEISLRGSTGVQVLINGKPSVLAGDGNALGSITAEMIDKIEVITNPSAKYDAEGTSGIINIVIKKEEREGLNGSVSLNTGIPDKHSFGLSMNRRTSKFNLFSQAGVGYRQLPRERENINRDLTSNTSVISSGVEYRNEFFYNFNLGADYYINDSNVITLSGSFAYEIEEQPSETKFDRLDENNELISSWNRIEVTSADNPKWNYELNYKKDFKDKKDHNLLFSAIGKFFGKDQNSNFSNEEIEKFSGVQEQQTATKFDEMRYTFNLDYINPISEKITLELGSQFVSMDVGNDFSVSNLIGNEWEIDDRQTNNFEFIQNVLGVYTTGAYEDDKWGLKLGLRVENTELNTLLQNTNERNNQNYLNFFPTVHSSYKLTDYFSVQAGYSRRIFRPRMRDLNPFFNIRNDFAIRQGNPNLLPEFTDSYEVSSIFTNKKLSLNTSLYVKYTTNKIDRVAIVEENVSRTAPYNIGTSQSTGIEINGKYSFSNRVSFNGDFNYSIFERVGSFEGTDFDFTAAIWTSKITGKVKLPFDFDIESTGQFRSKVQTVQGIQSGMVFANIGVRKKMMNGRTILSLSVRDIFASRINETEAIQPEFYLYSRNLRGRFITFGFSYGFGKGEAMEYTGRRR